MQFIEQKVLSSFVHRNDVMIDDTIESISEEFVRMLDSWQWTQQKLWGVTDAPKSCCPSPLFSVFNIFIESIIKLSHLEASWDDSLCQKTISIRNVTMTSSFTTFELIVSNKLNILKVIPSGKKPPR